MKIRIKGNTVRYRLSKSEVATLARTGMLAEQTTFVNGTLTYAIRQAEGDVLTADFSRDTITLDVPESALQEWASTEAVGMEHTMELPDGASLYLLLEKDFKCIDADVKEDQSDYFENPLQTC